MAVRAERLQLCGGHAGHAGHQPHQHRGKQASPGAAKQGPMQQHYPYGQHGAHQHGGLQHGGHQHAGHQHASPAPSPTRTATAEAAWSGTPRANRALRPLNSLSAAKRKSAVELLQESKAFYVKSDCVLDRQQRLQRPTSSPPCSPVPMGAMGAMGATALSIVTAPSTAPMPLSSALLSPPPSPSPLSSPCSGAGLGLGGALGLGPEPMPQPPPGFEQESSSPVAVSPRSLLLPKSPRLGLGGLGGLGGGSAGTTWAQRRAASQQLQSDRLQTKLRRLLNADSKENVFHDGGGDDDHDHARSVAGERALARSYGRSNSQTHHSYSSRTWSSSQVSGSLHKSLPDLHSSPTSLRHSVPRWSSDNSSNRGSSASSQSGEGGGYMDYMHRRSGSQRGSRTLHYSGDAMSVVSSGGRTHQSHRSQPAGPREHSGEPLLRRGGSSGSSSGARTHRSHPEGRSRANTVSEVLMRQGSGGSSAALSGMSSWSPRYSRSRPSSQYLSMRNTSAEEIEGSRESRGSRGSLGSRGSSHKSDHENYSSPQCSRVAELCWNFEPRRPILRSKSDISHRYSGSVNVPLSPPLQDPAQLEQFFEQLGLDNNEFKYVSRTRSNSSDSPVFFSSVSSVDSNNAGWSAPWSSHTNAFSSSAGGTAVTPGGMMGSGHSGKNIEQPSIVERNARIIKWLCNCRKAQKEMYQSLDNGNVS